MKHIKYPLSILYLLPLLLWSCNDLKTGIAGEYITEIESKHAPDKRVAVFDIKASGNQLIGETNLHEAHQELLEKLKEAGVEIDDKVTLLPHKNLEEKTRALVSISVANIRSSPKHSAELATQAGMGTPLKVLKEDDNWFLVQTPDGYISWVDAGGIALMSEEEAEAWYASDLVIFDHLLGQVYVDPTESEWVSDLTAGNILQKSGDSGSHFEVVLPDGRKGYVRKAESNDFDVWISERSTSTENLISTAKSMMGLPYLWGGTSIKGVDCSGFTKTIYFLNGKIIPRDASQQVHEGELVDQDKNWENLEVGDLLFFGVPAEDEEKEKVVHVGMWIGDSSFIHSRGRVRISSFDPESPLYDEYELNRYLRTKRIIGKESDQIFPVSALFN